MRCKGCGASTPDDERYCGTCGHDNANFKDVEQRHAHKVAVDRNNNWKTLVGVVIVVLIVIFAVSVLPMNRADITVEVYSTHILSPVDYALYINGDEKADGVLEPGHGQMWALKYRFPLVENGDIIVVSAISTGGVLGSQTDHQTIHVIDGNSYKVTLYV